ncbi:hypothetical protein [Kordia sp.]|uniref:hypothetical protein n=1 Tax=Kordia sp. TaxID=1965332 RepID=UPI003B5B0EE6
MGVSDLLSLIGIFLAIIAFLDSSERKFILNKFSTLDFFFILLYFIIVNYLIFYDWWSKNLDFLNYFEFINFPSASTWAYFISIILIVWFLYKILYASFPKKNKDKVLQFYNYLLAKKEYHNLFNYLEKYDFKKLTNKKSDSFQVILLEEVIGNKLFLKETASYNFEFVIELLHTNNNSILCDNFIYSQLSNQHSYILTNIDVPNSTFFKLLIQKDHVFKNSINYNLRHEISDLIILNKYVLKIYLFISQEKAINNLESLNDIFLKIIENNDILYLNQYFNNFFDIIVFTNNNIDSFEILFDSIINQLNHSLKSFDKDKLQTAFEIIFNNSLQYYEESRLKAKIIKSLTIKIEPESFNEFRKLFYECWRKSNKENEDYHKAIIKLLSNY